MNECHQLGKNTFSAQLYYNLGTYFGNCTSGGSNYEACIVTAQNAIKYFHTKAKMLTHEEAHELIGHDVGGVCSFALPENVKVYLDVSLRRFSTVFPAAGSSNSAIEMTCDELEKYSSNFVEWVDVCKGWREEA